MNEKQGQILPLPQKLKTMLGIVFIFFGLYLLNANMIIYGFISTALGVILISEST